MKHIINQILIIGLICVWCNNSYAQKKTLSPHASTMAMIGSAHVHIDYSSPGVRGRTIFGDLVPFNELWRAGANDATWIETNRDIEIGDQKLPAGKYGVFIIPTREEWIVIFNSRWKQHGTDKYNEKEDIIRVKVEPTTFDKLQERLKYGVIKVNEQSGLISMSWERTEIKLPFTIRN